MNILIMDDNCAYVVGFFQRDILDAHSEARSEYMLIPKLFLYCYKWYFRRLKHMFSWWETLCCSVYTPGLSLIYFFILSTLKISGSRSVDVVTRWHHSWGSKINVRLEWVYFGIIALEYRYLHIGYQFSSWAVLTC